MPESKRPVFDPRIPPDLDHAAAIREEALDWLETRFPGVLSFLPADVLRMAGEQGRRWLITRLRARKIGDEARFNLTDTADALAILFLRSKGVKFFDAFSAVLKQPEGERTSERRYGGLWNRLIAAAIDGLRRRLPARLLASAVFSLLKEANDHPNSLIVVKQRGKSPNPPVGIKIRPVTHDYVYHFCLERPSPAGSVITPSRELIFLPANQPPARSEITSRHFTSLSLTTRLETFEILLGTMRKVDIQPDNRTVHFLGRILDIVYVHFEEFLRAQTAYRLETPLEPEFLSSSDLELWLTTRLLAHVFQGSFCEINESSPSSEVNRVLASSAAKPWEPSPLEPAKKLEMLSGYASRVAVPLVVEKVDYPWTQIIEGVDSEVRYLKSVGSNGAPLGPFSALALPVLASDGRSIGSLYLMTPQLSKLELSVDVPVLSIFSRIVGETIERHRAALSSAEMSADIVRLNVLKREEFKAALAQLLTEKSLELAGRDFQKEDIRLPFVLISAHSPEPDRSDPAVAARLKKWLVETLCHLEWRSFIRSHWSGAGDEAGRRGFMGEVPGIGMMIAIGELVSKDDLDEIRSAFPTAFNRTTPTNSPVKLVAWVLDVPARRISEAAGVGQLAALADEIETWAFDVAKLVDDLAQSSDLAHEKGEWEAALKTIRRALQKPGAGKNSYLRRLAADCSLALGDWPSALKYAGEAVALSGAELGSGLVRSKCLKADAHLCLCQPLPAWELYSEVAAQYPSHPLPRYYRGHALLLMARLLRVYEDEERGSRNWSAERAQKIGDVMNLLVSGAMEDLTSAADLLERWGLRPESYQYHNFHLIPTLMGEGLGYLLSRSPGPAASRLQSALRAFPKSDIFLREFLFAKCWEQGIHRQYARFLLGKDWDPLRAGLERTLGIAPKSIAVVKGKRRNRK
jgi:tetratricopeptide (TPR) repeat protein